MDTTRPVQNNSGVSFNPHHVMIMNSDNEATVGLSLPGAFSNQPRLHPLCYLGNHGHTFLENRVTLLGLVVTVIRPWQTSQASAA